MDWSQAGGEVNVGGDKTPLSKLAKRFQGSVELWKAKYRRLKSEINRYHNRAHDARRSYDHWKERAPAVESVRRCSPTVDPLATTGSSVRLAGELIAFVSEQCPAVRGGERLVGTTGTLASAFGKQKTLERSATKSGFTRL